MIKALLKHRETPRNFRSPSVQFPFSSDRMDGNDISYTQTVLNTNFNSLDDQITIIYKRTYDASTEESERRISLSLTISVISVSGGEAECWLDMFMLMGDIVSLVSARLIVISGFGGSADFRLVLSSVWYSAYSNRRDNI